MPDIFNRDLHYQHLQRFQSQFVNHDIVHHYVYSEIAERLRDIKDPFDHFTIAHAYPLSDDDVKKIMPYDAPYQPIIYTQGGDEEQFYEKHAQQQPLKENHACLSLLTLQSLNDILGVFCQYKLSLQQNGVLIGALFGGDTLKELRDIFVECDILLLNGAAPHIAPLPQWQDIGTMLQKANFALPVVDRQFITLRYKDILSLLHEWRVIGGGNTRHDRYKTFMRHDYFNMLEQLYFKKYGDGDQRIPVTVEIIFFHGVSRGRG